MPEPVINPFKIDTRYYVVRSSYEEPSREFIFRDEATAIKMREALNKIFTDGQNTPKTAPKES